MKCRFCAALLSDVFLDLGSAPPSNAFLSESDLGAAELYFPLRLYTCARCHLVQVDEVQKHDALFAGDYVYFSSFSRSWLAHAKRYVEVAVKRLGLDGHSLVVEVASNDGYLLQYVKASGIPCVGIEPTSGTAAAARELGIESIDRFFGCALAHEFVADRGCADLIIGNNVLAHVPDLNDFVSGLSTMLAPQGVITVEFPHLMQLVAQGQFDTVYHEHFSYFSFHTAQRVFEKHGLRIWDVEELETHGGSLRLWVCRQPAAHRTLPSVDKMLKGESARGMNSMDYYHGFQSRADTIKNDFLVFLLEAKKAGKQVAGYGAAAKGNTLLNYAGVRSDLLAYVVDASPHKQGRYLPGSRIPVVGEAHLRTRRPDFVVILPWNIKAEIAAQLEYIRSWGGKILTIIPKLELT
ncbi:MAG: class I SAM-dependent methyltransferase [Dokdonella sp.]|uniref:class I SAM-dependent methyltransferase n=1 Tax=Dokdonella sp. TaxID=2291710 RepID=UPI0032676422